MDSLPTDLGTGLPSSAPDPPPEAADADADDAFFRVDAGLDRDTLLEVYAEVVDGARTVLAPFGLPAPLKKHCPAPLLLERLRPTFDLLLDAASEAAYAQRGLTEASVAVAVHHFVEEAADVRVGEALQRMQSALEEVVELADVVEITPMTSLSGEAAADREGEGRIATAEDLVTEMRRLGAALAAVESTYSPTTGEEGGGGKGTGVGLGRGGEGGKEEEEGVGGGEGVGLVAALVGGGEGRWSAAAKRRWMGRLLRAVAPRGKAAAVPWETGAALLEVYTAGGKRDGDSGSKSGEYTGRGGEGKGTEKGLLRSVHAAVLAPVMLSGGDPLCAALGALEREEDRKGEGEGMTGLGAFRAFCDAMEEAQRLAGVQADLEEAGGKLQEGCAFLKPLVEGGRVPASILACALVRRAEYLKAAHELEEAAEVYEEAVEADPQCGAAFLGRAHIRRLLSQHTERRRKLRQKRREMEGKDSKEGEEEEEEDDANEAAEEAAGVLDDLERAYALDGLKTPADLQLLESALKEALKSQALVVLEERLEARAWAGTEQNQEEEGEEASQQLPAKWLADSYFASFHDSDGKGHEARPSSTATKLTATLLHTRRLRFQGDYASALSILRSTVQAMRQSAAPSSTSSSPSADDNEGEGQAASASSADIDRDGERSNKPPSSSANNDSEGDKSDRAWLENEWGSYCYLRGDLHGARTAFQRALELDAGSVNSLIKLGEVLSDLGQAEEGLRLLDQAVQRSNGGVDALLHRGQLKLTQEDLGGAVRDLRRAVQAASDDDNSHQGQGQGHKGPPPVAYACLGTALFKLDETGESAQEVLGEAAKEHPDSLEVLLYHGDVLAQRGDLAGAMRSFQAAAEADPSCPLPFVNAARAYLSVRDYPQAERHLSKALALDPTCGATHLDMGQLHVQRGETAKAEAALGRALQQARYLPEILDALVFKRLAELQRLHHPVE